MSAQQLSITPEQLQTLIATAVESAVKAAKQPTVLEQKKLDEEEQARQVAQDQRKRLAASVKESSEQKKAFQRICTHEHRNGDTHMVFVQEQQGPGYLLCQKNQCIVRPGEAPKDYKGYDIYDTELFNRCFQKIATGAEIFG